MIVYIAGPYSGDEAENVRNAVKAAERVRLLGHLPYVPHLSHLWDLASPHSYAYWLKMGLDWVRACDCLIRLPGDSPGADTEVGLAVSLGIPVYYGVAEFVAAIDALS